MVIGRLVILPLLWAFLGLWAMVMLIVGGIYWVITGESQTIRLSIGN